MYELETVVKRLKSQSEHESVVEEASRNGAPLKRTRPTWRSIAKTPDALSSEDRACELPPPIEAKTAEPLACAMSAKPFEDEELVADMPAPSAHPIPVAALAQKIVTANSPSLSEDEDVIKEDIAAPRPRKDRYSPVVTVIGAVAAVALVVGVAIWTYSLGQRDALEVPIVRAMTAPARVPPERPGGLTTPHQGLAVNRVLEGGGVRPVARSVVTAPGNQTLTEEDATRPVLRQMEQANGPEPRIVITPPTDGTVPNVVVAEATPEKTAEPVATPDIVASNAVTPNGATTSEPTSQVSATIPKRVEANPSTLSDINPATESIDVAALPKAVQKQQSIAGEVKPKTAADALLDDAPLRPVGEARIRITSRAVAPGLGAIPATDAPASLSLAAEPAVLTIAERAFPPVGQGSNYAPAVITLAKARPFRAVLQTAAVTETEVNAAVAAAVSRVAAETRAASSSDGVLETIPLPTGTRMIQLGAYDSADIARREWSRFQRQHDDLLGEKASYVQRTDSSGRTFYRLRVAGYDNGSATRAACAALSARGLPCITVTLR